MFESYSLVLERNGTEIERADFDSLVGMKCVSVDDIASVEFALSTTTNPYLDGDMLQNRRANGRELTALFDYDYTISLEEADAELYRKISLILSQRQDDEIFLIKEKNGIEKRIKCSIKKIEHPVYDEKPKLSIVFSAAALWQGDIEEISLKSYRKSPYVVGRFVYEPLSFKGDFFTDFSAELHYKKHDWGGTYEAFSKTQCDLTISDSAGVLCRFNTRFFSTRSLAEDEEFIITYKSGVNPTLDIHYTGTADPSFPDRSLLNEVNSDFIQLPPKSGLEIVSNWAGISGGVYPYFTEDDIIIRYRPLYVR